MQKQKTLATTRAPRHSKKTLKTMIAQPIQTKQLSADGFTWNDYSPRVGSITNDMRHFSRVCYFAFDSWDDAHNFWKSITDKRLCSRAKVRESERFTNQPWEVKVWSMPEATLLKLVERDRNRTKPSSLPPLPIRRDWSLSESHDAIAIEAA